jgi:hypothetical protein
MIMLKMKLNVLMIKTFNLIFSIITLMMTVMMTTLMLEGNLEVLTLNLKLL